ncbi:MAG: hypothetical protein AUI14_06700 [Actinobacteria bacterium 13_2_20CM_2_71_6]|nr:MAG: hypothetical protein AUI14_06700 [Actinobacteria bacterium 13_2_20CM_2_71_6]
MDGLDRQPRGAQQRGGAVGVETPPQLVRRAGPPVRVGQRGGGDVQVAAHRPGQDGGGPVGDQDAGRATRAQRGGQRRDHLGRVVDDLQQTVAQDQVDAGGGGQFGQPVAVALDRGDPVGDPGVGGPAGQRGQRVRAGIDHGHPVPGLGQRDGEAAGAAADVEDQQALPALDLRAESGPHHGGTGCHGPALGSLHPSQPNGSRARAAGPVPPAAPAGRR